MGRIASKISFSHEKVFFSVLAKILRGHRTAQTAHCALLKFKRNLRVSFFCFLRYLIEGATGVYTGSVFHDKRIQREGHHGEFRWRSSSGSLDIIFLPFLLREPGDGSTLLQKTHHNSLVGLYVTQILRCIVLCRWISQRRHNPFCGEWNTSSSLEVGGWSSSGILTRRSYLTGTIRSQIFFKMNGKKIHIRMSFEFKLFSIQSPETCSAPRRVEVTQA